MGMSLVGRVRERFTGRCIMNGEKTLSPERIAEIKAFRNTDFTDCPIMTKEELKLLRPRHPESFIPKKETVQVRHDDE